MATEKAIDVGTTIGQTAADKIKQIKSIDVAEKTDEWKERIGAGAKRVTTRAKEFADIDEMKARTGRGIAVAREMKEKAMMEAQNKAALAMDKISEGQAAATNIFSNIVSTGGEATDLSEPPDEIESMGILLYNKNWGLA